MKGAHPIFVSWFGLEWIKQESVIWVSEAATVEKSGQQKLMKHPNEMFMTTKSNIR